MVAQRVQARDCLAFLREAVMRACPSSGSSSIDSIHGLKFHRTSCGGSMKPHFYEPLAILVVQGSKAIEVGNETLRCGPGACFLCNIDMPGSSCVVEASCDAPFLALSLSLDVSLVAELAAKMPPFPQDAAHFLGAGMQKAEPNLLDSFARLVELADHPAPALAELIVRYLLSPPR